MAPQTNEKKLITRSQVDPVHCLEQASALCRCTVRTTRWSWINEKNNNLAPLPMWKKCAQCANRCNSMCKNPSVCQHLSRTINTCLVESTFVLTPLCGLVVCRKSSRVGHPRPSLRGTGVSWVSCLDPSVCLRVQDDPEAKSQPIVVLVGVLKQCDGRVRGRGREKRVCVQLRILTPLLD